MLYVNSQLTYIGKKGGLGGKGLCFRYAIRHTEGTYSGRMYMGKMKIQSILRETLISSINYWLPYI